MAVSIRGRRWSASEGHCHGFSTRAYVLAAISLPDAGAGLTFQVMVFAALAFGWLLLFLLLPSLYRLFLEFPIRLLMHGIR